MSAMQPEQRNIPLASKYTAGFCGSGGIVTQVPSKGLWPNDTDDMSNRTIRVFIKVRLRRNTSYRSHRHVGAVDVTRCLSKCVKSFLHFKTTLFTQDPQGL